MNTVSQNPSLFLTVNVAWKDLTPRLAPNDPEMAQQYRTLLAGMLAV